MAMTAEITMKMAIITRITNIFFFSVILPFMAGPMRSRVMVEPLVSTREDKVDMEADKTSTKTMAMRTSGIPSNMVGMMASKPLSATNSGVVKSRPKPPMK